METISMNSLMDIFLSSLSQFLSQVIIWLPKLIVALLIWWAGKLILNLVVRTTKKVDIPKTNLDNKIIGKFNKVLLLLGRLILLLVVLDYLGIGKSIVSAIANGLTITIALILGISFGQAFVPEAEKIVNDLKKKVTK